MGIPEDHYRIGTCAFGYLLRHVDDEPNITDSHFRLEAAEKIVATALGFAVVGEVEGATKLLEILHTRGIDPFQITDFEYPFLKPCMYFAWDTTSSWPAWIPEDERTEAKLQELEVTGRRPWLERFSEDWDVSEETAKKARELGSGGIPRLLPLYNGTLAGQAYQAEIMWKNGDFPFAANPNGPMHIRYAKPAMWWRQGIYPKRYPQVYRTAGLMICLDVLLRLDKQDEAQDVLERICARFHMEEQVEQLACSRAAWKTYLAAPSRPLLELLGIHAAKLRSAVNRVVHMAEERMDTGPRRRYQGYDIERLAQEVSVNTFHNAPYDTMNTFRPLGDPRVAPETKHGLLRPGCSLVEITALEERLGVELPSDYKKILALTNGLGSMWDGQNMSDYLASSQNVCWKDVDMDFPLNLLPDSNPRWYRQDAMAWPEFPANSRGICLHGGARKEDAGGDLWLLPRATIQLSLDYFFKTYEERSSSQREELDRVVQELYGSLEAFRNMDFALGT